MTLRPKTTKRGVKLNVIIQFCAIYYGNRTVDVTNSEQIYGVNLTVHLQFDLKTNRNYFEFRNRNFFKDVLEK
jgi:hypothetical protein